MKKKISDIIKSPSFSVLIFTAAMIAVLWSYGHNRNSGNPAGNSKPIVIKASVDTVTSSAEKNSAVTSVTTSKTVSTTKTTSTVSTTSTTSSTAATTSLSTTAVEETSTEPETENTYIIYETESSNSEFYQERLVIAGDSIASGFAIYGCVPYERSIATESVGIWNYDSFTFNVGYGDMGLLDNVGYLQPQLLYVSMGMNDMPMNSPEWFADEYCSLIMQILERSPNTVVVAAGVTPVAYDCQYTTNENIRNYNSALEGMIEGLGSPQVYYFDAYSVLAYDPRIDPDSSLRTECSAGDGIHIASQCYNDILARLFVFLDENHVSEPMLSYGQ